MESFSPSLQDLHNKRKDWPHYRPLFCSGPCVKPKEWELDLLSSFMMGRSHRSVEGVALIEALLQRVKKFLGIPDSYFLAFNSGSASSAMDMALWNLLEHKKVDTIVWDVFSQLWCDTMTSQLGLEVNVIGTPAGTFLDPQTALASCSAEQLENHFNQNISPERDLVITWTGTTSGIAFPNLSWLKSHEGLVICDATAAVMTTELPWESLDATAFSWQKGFGGEASLGLLALSPKAMDRLKKSPFLRPIPRILRLKTLKGDILGGVAKGEAINTVSMLLIHEYHYLLDIWEKRGNVSCAVRQSHENFLKLESGCWDETGKKIFDLLVNIPEYRAWGPICFFPTLDQPFHQWDAPTQWKFIKEMCATLEENDWLYDSIGHAGGRPCLRLWCGPSVETSDVKLAMRIARRAFGPESQEKWQTLQ